MSKQLCVRALLLAASILLVAFFATAATPISSSGDQIQALIQAGEFKRADRAILERLGQDTTLSASDRLALEFERERLSRVRRDFRKTESEVRSFIAKWMPNATEADNQRWEKSGVLEMMLIDGKKCYFNSAARNLFSIDSAAGLSPECQAPR
jgi:hypothetical protein